MKDNPITSEQAARVDVTFTVPDSAVAAAKEYTPTPCINVRKECAPTMKEAEDAARTLCYYLEAFGTKEALNAAMTVHDIICHYSEEGTDSQQEARLKFIGCFTP